jgi:hypothetical protein
MGNITFSLGCTIWCRGFIRALIDHDLRKSEVVGRNVGTPSPYPIDGDILRMSGMCGAVKPEKPVPAAPGLAGSRTLDGAWGRVPEF